ncbi:MAG: hypothetical protein K1Y36_27355 [Blastocatellia bacterium]|nr:hypothetical protein [Blastocatellia bacterium]
MRSLALALMLAALPALAAGFLVLTLADVGRGVWLLHGISLVVMLALAGGLQTVRVSLSRFAVVLIPGVVMVLCAFPLLGTAAGPERWVRLGPVTLYVAPVVLPLALVVVAQAHRWGEKWKGVGFLWLKMTAFVLALQPDLAQVVALSGATVVVVLAARMSWLRRAMWCVPLAPAIWLATRWPDPLTPVNYVEGVFRLAWEHSPLAGLAVVVAALTFLVVFAWRLAKIDQSLVALAVYYGFLLAGSVWEITPAPLIGFGAGPVIGFGLAAGTVALMQKPQSLHLPN